MENLTVDPVVSVLLEEKILDESTLQEVLAEQRSSGKGLISIIKSRGLVSAEQLTKLAAAGEGIEFINLSADMVDPVAVRLVSFDIARQYNLIPVRIEKDKLFVAMSSPLNLSARDIITTRTGYRVVPLAATAEAVKQAITYHFSVGSVTRQDIVAMRLKDSADGASKANKAKYVSDKVTNAPIVRLVESMIAAAIDARASDIHIQPQEPDMKVRYRIDGVLVEALDVPASANREVISHIKVLADMDISERRVPQDGHISIWRNGKEYDLRVSSLPVVGGEKIVIRILDTTTGVSALNDVAADGQDYQRLHSLISNPYGMLLMTGPTGCGKTTTLYSIMRELNSSEKNIVTVEDPVEYRLSGITQVQVKPRTGMTFAASLRSILRQDPDIILVGEIRDLETAEIAVSAAQTGHFVLSTLHTNDAVGAVSRLVHLGIKPFMVSSGLIGVVAQRLIRTICRKCAQPYRPTEQEVSLLGTDGWSAGDFLSGQGVFYRGTGCDFCRKSGYYGRQAVFEILEATPETRKMIIEGASADLIKQSAVRAGMRTLRMQGLQKVLNGSTTCEEFLRVIDVREE